MRVETVPQSLLFRILAERGFRIAIDRAEILERKKPMDEVE